MAIYLSLILESQMCNTALTLEQTHLISQRYVDITRIHWVKIHFGKHHPVIIRSVQHFCTGRSIICVQHKLLNNTHNKAWNNYVVF